MLTNYTMTPRGMVGGLVARPLVESDLISSIANGAGLLGVAPIPAESELPDSPRLRLLQALMLDQDDK